MRQVITGVLSVVFVIGLAGASSAGMMDALKGQAEEANKVPTDAQKGAGMKDAGKEAGIEAQSAAKEQTGGMMDQLKAGAKGEVNKTGKTANDTIDNLGK